MSLVGYKISRVWSAFYLHDRGFIKGSDDYTLGACWPCTGQAILITHQSTYDPVYFGINKELDNVCT